LEAGVPAETLLARWKSGRIKQRVLARCLADRAAAPALYAEGDYEPLQASGGQADHVIAFLRQNGDEALLVVAPRLVADLTEGDAPPLGAALWSDTRLRVPPGRWRDVITGAKIEADQEGVALRDLFATLPVAALRRTA
jgi:(1->4)-alpha-D-glucan 1-alpha-D-glucosylmutase